MLIQGFIAASSDDPQDFTEIKVIPFGVADWETGKRIIQRAICIWAVKKYH